ncbi:hypothetical protein Gotur_017722 [Gossypium turneri]
MRIRDTTSRCNKFNILFIRNIPWC